MNVVIYMANTLLYISRYIYQFTNYSFNTFFTEPFAHIIDAILPLRPH